MRLPKFKVFQAAMMVLKTTWIRNFIGIFESSFKTELFVWNGRNLIIPSNVRMLANDQRTTNLLEGPGGTDGFRVVDVSHPDVYKLLISLIREASQNRNNHRCPNSMWWTKNRPRKKGNFKKQRFTQSCQPLENEIIKKLVHVAIVLQFLSKIYCPWGWGSWISPSLSNHKQLKIFRKPSNGYRRNGYQQVTWVISNRWIVFVVSTRTRTPCTIDKYWR